MFSNFKEVFKFLLGFPNPFLTLLKFKSLIATIMSEAAQSGTSNYEPRTERVQIKPNHIPDSLLESVLTNLISQANDRYRKIQGDIDINTFQNSIQSQRKSKRTIKDINESIDISKEYETRLNYCNAKVKDYDIISSAEMLEKKTTTNAPMADIVKLSVLEIMQESISSKFGNNKDDLQIRKNVLSTMSEWSELFLQSLTHRLQRLMEIQRRRQPDRNDIRLLEREGLFDKSGIHDMYDLSTSWSKSMENKEKYQRMVNKADIASTAYNGTDEGSFNAINYDVQAEEQWWIDQIVHRKKRKAYIPEWMPPLPPDYTFKSTPKYNETVKDPVILRQKIVNEGRLGEKALDHTIARNDHKLITFPLPGQEVGDAAEGNKDESTNKPSYEDESTNKLEDIIDKENKNPEKNLIAQNSKITDDQKVDLIKLAKKRMAVLDNKREKEEQRIASRVESDESKLGRNFGFYSSVKKLPDNSKIELNEYRSNNLNKLIRNLQKQEQMHTEWLSKQEALRKKIEDEKSKYAEANEIQIGGIENSANNESFMFSNVDEDVDFDVEFSDIEDFQTEKSEEIIRPNEVQVRFEEEPKSVESTDINNT